MQVKLYYTMIKMTDNGELLDNNEQTVRHFNGRIFTLH